MIATAHNVRRVLSEILAEAQEAHRYGDCSTGEWHEDGYHHYARGGAWNAQSADRIGYGISKGDVTLARRELLKVGYRVSFDEADAMLLQLLLTGKVDIPGLVMAMTPAERKRAQRERLRELGLCTQCPVSRRRKAMKGKTVCKACNEAAKARVYAARARERKNVA